MFKKNLLLTIATVAASFALQAAEYHISPTGSSSGDGSQSRPWDLQTALNHPASVRAGDTLWMRAGVHRRNNAPTKFTSRLTGAAGTPIIVRQYPGERATVDGSIEQSSGRYVTYWGFEVMCSNPNRYASEIWATGGMDLRAPNLKCINMVIHDSFGNGVFIATSASNPELYGILSYYNGFQASDRGHGHGLYAQSQSPSVAKIHESLFFANYGLGVQAYGTAAPLDNMQFEGNAAFCASAISSTAKQLSNFLIGRESGYANNPVVIRNFVYDYNGNGGSDVNLGYAGGLYNPVVRSNYFQTGTMFASPSGSLSVSGNSFMGGVSGISQSSYPNNNYSTARPSSNMIEVRPNKYEPGRANIIVYNWQNLSSVAVDISSALPVGTAFEVRNVWNFFGAPVLSGTYNGGTISLPMTGLSVSKPVGTSVPVSSAPTFNVFVLLPKGEVDNTPENPTISTIANQTTSEDTAVGPITFTVSDPDTSAANLAVSATSGNSTLVPNGNIALGGSGNTRTLTITPAPNQFGSATITIAATDGSQSASTSFTLTVSSVNDAPAISSIPNATIPAGTSSGPLAFTVSDLETPAGNLTLLASSSNPALLPNAGIAFGGTGANRTVTLNPVAGQAGTATVTVSLSDGATTVLRTLVLTVTPNTPPQLVYLPFEAEEGTLVTPMQVVTQPASPTCIASPTANQGSVTLTVNIPVAGTYYAWCSVLAPTYASDSFFVSVDRGAEDIFDAAEGTWTNAHQWSLLNGRAGGAPLTLNPRSLTLAAGNHTLTFRAREANTGLDKIILSNDPDFVPSEQTPVNQAPTISQMADQKLSEGMPSATLPFVIGDAETPAAELTVAAGSSNPALIPVANIVLGGSGANRTVVVTPVANQAGSATITLRVDDGELSAQCSFVVTVEPVTQVIEAETGVLVSPMTIGTDPLDPTCRHVSSSTANQGTVSLTVNIPVAGNYMVWCKVLASTYASDSFFVSIDGTSEDVYDAAEGSWKNSWQWSKLNGRGGGAPLTLNPRTFALTAGTHTIVFRGREANAALDKIIVTRDMNYQPQ